MVKRFKNVIIAILKELHPNSAKALDELRIEFNFSDPFEDSRDALWSGIVKLRSAGLVSLETAVGMLNLTGDNQSEIERLQMEAAEAQEAALAAKNGGEQQPGQQQQQNEEGQE